MSFLNERFPVAVSLGASGGPGFLTDVVVTNSGAESRDSVWENDRGQWEVSHAAKLPAQYEPLRAFFRAARGRANTFRFQDPTDHSVSASEGKFLQLTTTTFQCLKRYTFGSQTYDRVILLPVSTISVTGGSGVSVNYSTGVVTVASGTPSAWSGEFDCLCRFDTDRMHAEIVEKSVANGLIITWSSIPIVEVPG